MQQTMLDVVREIGKDIKKILVRLGHTETEIGTNSDVDLDTVYKNIVGSEEVTLPNVQAGSQGSNESASAPVSKDGKSIVVYSDYLQMLYKDTSNKNFLDLSSPGRANQLYNGYDELHESMLAENPFSKPSESRNILLTGKIDVLVLGSNREWSYDTRIHIQQFPSTIYLKDWSSAYDTGRVALSYVNRQVTFGKTADEGSYTPSTSEFTKSGGGDMALKLTSPSIHGVYSVELIPLAEVPHA